MKSEIFSNVATASNKALDLLLNLKTKGNKVASECASLNFELARLHNASKAAFEVIPTRTTIGVFGASQAGKSYLVSNIAAASGVMKTKWGEHEVDFLADVNPSGGDKEATGIVTRFTHRSNSGIPNFPIEVRVMSEIEIVMILANAFYKDFNFEGDLTQTVNAMFKEESLQEHFKSCENFPKVTSEVSFNDLVKLYDYLKKVASAPLATLDIDSPFWSRFFALAQTLSLEGRAQLYSILWGKLEVLTVIFKNIGRELLKLKGASLVYAKTDVYFYEQDGRRLQYEDNINSVTSLDHLFDKDMREVEVALDDKAQEVVKVKIPLFAATVLEVLFPLEGHTPLENFDVLDFPGARSRNPYTYQTFKEHEREISGEVMPAYLIEQGAQLIRRGKVAYLFDRYNNRHEIDIMLFCLNSSAQSEVSSLTTIITDWIYTNIGRDAKERTSFGKNPLVGVFTRFDEAFMKAKNAMASVDGNSKVIATAIERIKGEEWLNAWNLDNSGLPQSLRQFFFVRRPNIPYSADIFHMENGVETAVLDELKDSIADFCKEVRAEERFDDLVYGGHDFGAQTLEAVFTPSDGGASYINKFLLENYHDFRDIKKHFIESIKLKLSEIESVLKRYVSADGDKASQAAKAKAQYIIESLKQCIKVANFFSDLHTLQELSARDLHENYVDNYSQSMSNSQRFASEALKRYNDLLDDMCTGGGFEQLFGILNLSWGVNEQNNAAMLENGQEDYSFFYDKAHKCFISDKAQLKKAFANLMRDYTSEIKKALEALDMKRYLIEVLNEDEAKGLSIEYLASIQVRKIMRIMSDFSTYLRSYTVNNNKASDGRQYYTENYETDGLLPKLTQEHLNLATHYVDDYFGVLGELICGVNLNTTNQYGLTNEENNEFLAILHDFEQGLNYKDEQ